MKKSGIVILKDYFGYRPGMGLKGFADEVKALTPEDKAELVALAAVELGVEVIDEKPTLAPAA